MLQLRRYCTVLDFDSSFDNFIRVSPMSNMMKPRLLKLCFVSITISGFLTFEPFDNEPSTSITTQGSPTGKNAFCTSSVQDYRITDLGRREHISQIPITFHQVSRFHQLSLLILFNTKYISKKVALIIE